MFGDAPHDPGFGRRMRPCSMYFLEFPCRVGGHWRRPEGNMLSLLSLTGQTFTSVPHVRHRGLPG